MTLWTDAYRLAIADVRHLAGSRGILSPELSLLLDDLEGDALVIEHASDNRLRRARLRVVAREALPLFDKEGAP